MYIHDIVHREQCNCKQCGSVLLLMNNKHEYEIYPVSARKKKRRERWVMCRVCIAQCTGEVYWEQCRLYSLTAAAGKDLRYLSFTHFGCISLSLKELQRAMIVSCRGWESRTMDKLSTVLHCVKKTSQDGAGPAGPALLLSGACMSLVKKVSTLWNGPGLCWPIITSWGVNQQ